MVQLARSILANWLGSSLVNNIEMYGYKTPYQMTFEMMSKEIQKITTIIVLFLRCIYSYTSYHKHRVLDVAPPTPRRWLSHRRRTQSPLTRSEFQSITCDTKSKTYDSYRMSLELTGPYVGYLLYLFIDKRLTFDLQRSTLVLVGDPEHDDCSALATKFSYLSTH